MYIVYAVCLCSRRDDEDENGRVFIKGFSSTHIHIVESECSVVLESGVLCDLREKESHTRHILGHLAPLPSYLSMYCVYITDVVGICGALETREFSVIPCGHGAPSLSSIAWRISQKPL